MNELLWYASCSFHVKDFAYRSGLGWGREGCFIFVIENHFFGTKSELRFNCLCTNHAIISTIIVQHIVTWYAYISPHNNCSQLMCM